MSTVRRTACNRDCPDACSILVTVDSNAGSPERATMLRGDPDDPVTRGFLCERTSRFLTRQYDPARFTQPMLRRGGKQADLVPVTWDEALDVAAAKLLAARRDFGPASILHYRSGGSLGILKPLADHLFEQFGPVSTKRGDICSGAGEAAQEADFGVSDSHDIFDLLNSRTIVLWGKNVHTSNVHLLPVLRQAREKGARIVAIDLVRTRAAELAELFLMPRPGGDFALAMAVARWIFDHGRADPAAAGYCKGLDVFRAVVHARDIAGWCALADVPVGEAERLAELYADGPSSIQVGWGLARRAHGAASVRALDALGAISGNLGVPGGGVSYYYRRRASFDTSFVRGLAVAPRSFSEALLGQEILAATDPPVRAAWITAGNPVSMLPDSDVVRRALLATDFVVVVDTHPTDTTDVADLVLPTLTLLEDSDVLGAFGNHWLRVSEPALAPPGEARHELTILQGLAQRLGLGPVMAGSVDDWKRRVMSKLRPRGVELEDLRRGPVRNPFAPPVLFADRRFPTPSGKVELLDEAPPPPPPADPEHPLQLLSVSTPRAQSSQWSVELPPGPAELRVHPASAAGVPDGGRARLASRRAALEVVVRHDERVRPGVAHMDKGGMLRDGRCANRLVAAALTDRGEGAAYYDEPVRLEA